MDYNVHFFDRAGVFLNTTQLKMINWDLEKILNRNIKHFYPPAEYVTAKQAMDRAFKTDSPVWSTHCVGGTSYLWLIKKISKTTVAVPEVFDDPENRQRLKEKLWAAAGNWQKQSEKLHCRAIPDTNTS